MKPSDVSCRDVGLKRGQGSEGCEEKRWECGIFAGKVQPFLNEYWKSLFDNFCLSALSWENCTKAFIYLQPQNFPGSCQSPDIWGRAIQPETGVMEAVREKGERIHACARMFVKRVWDKTSKFRGHCACCLTLRHWRVPFPVLVIVSTVFHRLGGGRMKSSNLFPTNKDLCEITSLSLFGR